MCAFTDATHGGPGGAPLRCTCQGLAGQDRCGSVVNEASCLAVARRATMLAAAGPRGSHLRLRGVLHPREWTSIGRHLCPKPG